MTQNIDKKRPKELQESNGIVDRIFEYDNYRQFLKDFFQEQRTLKNFFSHRYFAQRAGFGSHSFCAYIMDGKRNLSHNSIKKMIKGIGIRGKKASFFETLVLYNQCDTVPDKEKFFKSLQRIRKSTEFYKVNEAQLAYYDQWYYPVLRELVVYSDWKNDYKKLCSLMRPAITPEQARKAVETLLEIKMLSQSDDGIYTQSSQVVTAEKIPSYVYKNSRKEFILKAIDASDNFVKSERHIAYSILAMSDSTFAEAKKLLNEVRKKILVLAMEDEQVDRIFSLNAQLFPLSHALPKNGNNK
jgi:uncharacterized protein (TIGR02147 family)